MDFVNLGDRKPLTRLTEKEAWWPAAFGELATRPFSLRLSDRTNAQFPCTSGPGNSHTVRVALPSQDRSSLNLCARITGPFETVASRLRQLGHYSDLQVALLQSAYWVGYLLDPFGAQQLVFYNWGVLLQYIDSTLVGSFLLILASPRGTPYAITAVERLLSAPRTTLRSRLLYSPPVASLARESATSEYPAAWFS
jgi:hypothetical protein